MAKILCSKLFPNLKASVIVRDDDHIFCRGACMKTKLFAAAVIAVLLANIAALTLADTKGAHGTKRQTSRLVSLLPASDGVAVFDSRRFFDNALPQLLSANQPVLSEVLQHLTEIESKTGIDLRKFDQFALGVTFNRTPANKVDIDAVALASGEISAGGLIAVVKIASDGKYREEKIGEHTVYIFSPKQVIQQTTVKTSGAKIGTNIDHALKGFSKEIAVTALDGNTLAMGSLERVRETIEGKTHVGADIAGLLSQKETAIGSFAVSLPNKVSALFGLDNDQLSRSFDSIQMISGSAEVAATGTTLQMVARTKRADQAQDLKDTLEGMRILGNAFLGNAKGADKQVFSRMIKNARIDSHGNDVTLDLTVPQSDIDVLVAGIKVK